MTPNNIPFFQAYVDTVKAMQWESLVVLYEEGEGLLRLQEVLKLSTSNKELQVILKQLIPGPEGDYR